MILHRISVENWRCFLSRVEVGPFSESINVLHAPNASGKTSLFQALLRGLLDSHRTKGQGVEELRPWGRSLSPGVTVEFSQNGARWRIRKQFLDSPSAVLERFEDGGFVRFAEGEAADRETRNMFSRNPPARGLSRPENWGIAQVLWVPQGELGYRELTGDLVADVRAALGAQFVRSGEEPFQKKIEEAYNQFFTGGGKLKTGKGGTELGRLREELESAKSLKAELERRHSLYEESARAVEDLRARRAQARREAESISAALQTAREQAKTYRGLLIEIESQREKSSSAEARHQAIAERIDSIRHTERGLEELRTNLVRHREELPEREKEVLARESEAAAAKAKLEDIRHRRSEVDHSAERAERARAYLETGETLDRLNASLLRIAELRETLAQLRAESGRIVAPDSSQLRDIRDLARVIDEMNVRIESALISVELVPREARTVQILDGEETGERTLSAGSPFEAKGSPEVVIDLEGFGRIRASGPSGSVEEFRTKRNEAEKRLGESTRAYGTSSVRELEAIAEARDRLDKKAAEIKAQLSALLSGRPIESLEADRLRLEASRRSILEQEPEWEVSPPVWEDLRQEADRIKRDFIRQVETAEAERDSKQTAFAAAATRKTSLFERCEEMERQSASLGQRLKELTQDGAASEEREKQKREAALAWEAAREKLRAAEEALGRYEGNPIDLVENLERQIEAADRNATAALEREKHQEGRLQELSGEGTYSALAEAEERAADLERRVEEETVRVGAIRLLYDTLRDHHDRAMETVLKPVADLVSRNLERIGGSRFGRLRLGENFEPKAMVPRLADNEVSIDQLSGGETEQVFLVTRLALAETLAQEERQLVVLDDILTATDAGRLARIMTLLEESAERLQILILTCHPERYGGLKGGKFVDLELAIQSAGGG